MSTTSPAFRLRRPAGAAAAVLACLAVAGCPGGRDPKTLQRDDPRRYWEMVTAFYTAVTALRGGDEQNYERLVPPPTRIVPEEPAGWANLGLMHLRGGRMDAAMAALDKAQELAPSHSRILEIRGIAQAKAGAAQESIATLRKAVQANGANVAARFALAKGLEGQADPAAEAERLSQFRAILEHQPSNLRAAAELAVEASRAGDAQAVKAALSALQAVAKGLQPSTRQYVTELAQSFASADQAGMQRAALFLRNVLKAEPLYQQYSAEIAVSESPKILADPVEEFIALPPAPSAPSPADEGLRLTGKPVAMPGRWDTARAVVLVPSLPKGSAEGHRLPAREQGPLHMVAARTDSAAVAPADGRGTPQSLPFPGGGAPAPAAGILAADWDYDFLTDLVLAGAGGVRLYRQEASGRFADATAEAKLPPAVQKGRYSGAWALDVESDGDLDILVGGPAAGPLVLRNNRDGTFAVQAPFAGLKGLRAFEWADLDDDGDVDAALIDGAGRLHIQEDLRAGLFQAAHLPEVPGEMAALAVGDFDSNGELEVAVAAADGTLRRIRRNGQGQWESVDFGRLSSAPSGALLLSAVDLDLNGAADLVASDDRGAEVLLGDGKGGHRPLPVGPEGRRVSPGEPTEQGRPTLAGVDANGRPIVWEAAGSRGYHWQIVRPRAHYVAVAREQKGDGRINSFGVGGTLEVRAGNLLQRVPLTGSQVLVGLGEQRAAAAHRVVWPHGGFQGEYRPAVDSVVVTSQRLTGSCPWLFAWNGRAMEFVTDALWKSPLGLRINAQGTADVAQTMDWVKVRGDQLAPRDGFYELSITAELWETNFFDFVRLRVVDHPEGTDMHIDERFALPMPPLAIHATTPPVPPRRAVDDRGGDVTALVAARDNRHVDSFGPGDVQGVTRDHWLEVELGDPPPGPGPELLVAHGWIHPTDSSINVALGQSSHAPPAGLRLEVPDGRGGWRIARSGLGFPAGKTKTVLLDITGLLPAGRPRRLRLGTNLEVFWDQVGHARGLPGAEMRVRELAPTVADLRYRGFSRVEQPSWSTPEIPLYSRVERTGQMWRDLEGFYTRFGDVRELLNRVDDRYVIMNAGDEILLKFQALPPPPRGWVRDYVFVSDGWDKDGNLNTRFSRTVLPLPSHADPAYTRPPGRLEDDPVYRRHRQDWETYHTRYVSPMGVARELRPRAAR